MKYGRVVFSLIFFGVVICAYSIMQDPHKFSESECGMCHTDVGKNPAALKTKLSAACDNCHADARQKLSHPVDLFPGPSVPADLPLEDDMLTCITCHFVHPFSIRFKKYSYFLLRRPGRGPVFCSVCHKIDEKGHILFENVHLGSYQVDDQESSLDRYTLQCIECHDDKIDDPRNLGAGRWQHFSGSKLNHAVGVSYVGISAQNQRDYNPAGMLPSEIRLFNGKIGCGTCHNVYSKEKFMLVTSNWASNLCFACHIK